MHTPPATPPPERPLARAVVTVCFATLALVIAGAVAIPIMVPQRHIVFVCNRRTTALVHPVLKLSHSSTRHSLADPGIAPGECVVADFRERGGGSTYELFERIGDSERLLARRGYTNTLNNGDAKLLLDVTDEGVRAHPP